QESPTQASFVNAGADDRGDARRGRRRLRNGAPPTHRCALPSVCDLVAPIGRVLAFVGDSVASVGDLVAPVGSPVALVRAALTFVGNQLAFVRNLVALVRDVRRVTEWRSQRTRGCASVRIMLAATGRTGSLSCGLLTG